MKKLLKIATFLAIGFAAGIASAQTNTATATITVTPPKVAAVVSIAPPALTTAPGGTASLTIQVVAASGTTVPTGTVELLGEAPGGTGYTLVSTFPLVNGVATCSYPVPATAPAGTYSLEAAYSGDGTFLASPTYK